MNFESAVVLGLLIFAGIALGAKIIAGSLARSHQAVLDRMSMPSDPREVSLMLVQKVAERQERAASASRAAENPAKVRKPVDLPSLSPADPPLKDGASLIYVSAPTSGVISDGRISSSFLEYLVKLRQEFPQLSIIAPVVHDHALQPIMAQMSQGKTIGGASCEPLLKACDELWLIEYWGFGECAVVTADLAAAKRLGKTIRHFSPGSALHLQITAPS